MIDCFFIIFLGIRSVIWPPFRLLSHRGPLNTSVTTPHSTKSLTRSDLIIAPLSRSNLATQYSLGGDYPYQVDLDDIIQPFTCNHTSNRINIINKTNTTQKHNCVAASGNRFKRLFSLEITKSMICVIEYELKRKSIILFIIRSTTTNNYYYYYYYY